MQDKGPSAVLKFSSSACEVYMHALSHVYPCVRRPELMPVSSSIALHSRVTGHRASGILLSTRLTGLGSRTAIAPGFYMDAEAVNLDPGSGSIIRTEPSPHLRLACSFSFPVIFFFPSNFNFTNKQHRAPRRLY